MVGVLVARGGALYEARHRHSGRRAVLLKCGAEDPEVVRAFIEDARWALGRQVELSAPSVVADGEQEFLLIEVLA